MADFYHSVRLDRDKCRGCTNCIKRCPTGAIRVRGGKAHIIKERCIDCGECINVCPHHAKYAEYESLEKINEYKYLIEKDLVGKYPHYVLFCIFFDRKHTINEFSHILL